FVRHPLAELGAVAGLAAGEERADAVAMVVSAGAGGKAGRNCKGGKAGHRGRGVAGAGDGGGRRGGRATGALEGVRWRGGGRVVGAGGGGVGGAQRGVAGRMGGGGALVGRVETGARAAGEAKEGKAGPVPGAAAGQFLTAEHSRLFYAPLAARTALPGSGD